MSHTDDGALVREPIRAIRSEKSPSGGKSPEGQTPELFRGIRLGALAPLLAPYARAAKGGTGSLEKPKKCTLICCADHGVAEMQVSAYPPETTAQMTANYLLAKGAVANALAAFAKSDLFVADLGIKAPLPPLPALIDCKIAPGTKNSAKGPAMTREEALRSLATGIRLADRLAAEGYRCFLPGEMGISNTTASAAIAASLCRLTPEEATGRGTNISDARLKTKIEVVRQILAVNRPDAADGIDVLQKVGGFELGCIAGLILGAAQKKAVVILDGFNTGAAALIAAALAPAVRDFLLPSHLAAEPAHKAILRKLRLTPCMDMRFRLGEATGSSIVADFLDAAIEAVQAAEPDRPETEGSESAAIRERKAPAQEGADIEKRLTQPRSLRENAPQDAALSLPEPPALDEGAMDACQKRIDSLAKPIYSLGRLEELAVRLAGVTGEARPPLSTRRALLVFATEEPSPRRARLAKAFAAHAEAPVTLALLDAKSSVAEAFAFGQEAARSLAEDCPLLGISFAQQTDEAAKENAALWKEALHQIKADDTLLALLHSLPPALRLEATALSGAISGAAACRTLVLLDDAATESAAHAIETLAPAFAPFLLHVQSDFLALSLHASCGIAASLGLRLIDAALHMANDMKTFAETAVAVAADGPGKGRQG